MQTSETPPTPTDPPTRLWSLVAILAAGTVVALALTLVATVVTRLGEDRPRASAGDIVRPEGSGPLPSDAVTVDLPWGPVSVAVGGATDEVPEELGDGSLIAPPDGGSFVRVDLQPSPTKGGGHPFVSTGSTWQSRAEVVLTADGTDYPVDGPDGLGVGPGSPAPTGAPSRWVAVDGHPSDLSVTVTVAGEDQVVAADGTVTRGKAEPLGDLPTMEEIRKENSSTCGGGEQSGSSRISVEPSDVSGCAVDASLRTPFVDGLGWAPKEHEYLVVQTSYDDVDLVTREGESWIRDMHLSARLDDATPEDRARRGGPALGTSATHGSIETFVFEVPADEPTDDLDLLLDIEASPDDPFSEDTERLRLAWTIPNEELA